MSRRRWTVLLILASCFGSSLFASELVVLPLPSFLGGPEQRICFPLASGWTSDGYDENSESVTIRHDETQIRVRANEDCWLFHVSPSQVEALEVELLGFGERLDTRKLGGRHGTGGLALYAPHDIEGNERLAPIVGCVPIRHFWLYLEGAVLVDDVHHAELLLERGTFECGQDSDGQPSNKRMQLTDPP